MPIPGPGTAISINTIVGEFGGSVPHSISEYYRGGGLVPNTPGNSAIPTSGAIALGNFYGSANRAAYTLTISANTQNYDVYTNRGPSYVAGASDITVQINPGVIVGSSSVPAYALLVPSSFSPGDTITIVNNGSILGMGGTGGAGGNAGQTGYGTTGGQTAGSPGSSGGNSVYVNRPTTITNNGTIAAGGGGGGGGGGGQAGPYPSGKNQSYFGYVGGGGGGGAGNTVGPGGSVGIGNPGPIGAPTGGSPGNPGASTTGGSGGPGGSNNGIGGGPYGGGGGTGGGGGAAGSSGGSSTLGATTGGGSGGASANYITGNSFVTWPATGTRLGGVA